MDVRQKDSKGLTVCPQCGRRYVPELGKRPEGDRRPIQDIFPDSTKTQREQLITGICSDRCWNRYLGVG